MAIDVESSGGEIEYEVVPGTIYLVDILENNSHLQHAGSNDIVLVPQPSADPRDPLLWSKLKKGVFIAILWIYAFLLGGISLGISTVYTNVKESIGASALQMNAGAATQLIFLGIGNVICVPLTLKFGRRPIYLGTMLVLLCSQLLQMSVQTEGQLIGSYVLSGLGGAPFDVLVEISFADITFAHQRGSIMALYLLAPSLGSFLGPLWQGYMATNMGDWRWVMRWGAIFCGIIILLMIFFLEESLFYRDTQHREVAYTSTVTEPNETNNEINEKTNKPDTETETPSPVVEVPPETPSSSVSRLALWRRFPISWTVIGGEIAAGVTSSVTYPAILWAGLFYGTIISWLTVMATTEAEFLFLPPYNFDAAQVGNMNIAPFIGCVLAFPIAGYINDRIVLSLARRNKGYSEPEFRLWILLPLSFLQGGGLIIYGCGVARGMPFIMPAFGMGIIGFCLVTGISTLLSYVMDCYKEISEVAITGVLFVRAVFATGFTFAVQPWIESSGVENAFIAMGCIGWAGFASAIVFIKWGKRFRHVTAKRYIEASLKTL